MKRSRCDGCDRKTSRLKTIADANLCKRCYGKPPEWCLVYERLGMRGMSPVPRAAIPNLPETVRGPFVNVCGRQFWESKSKACIPSGNPVAVRRTKAGEFEYYSWKPEG